jgi:hypothetical protein
MPIETVREFFMWCTVINYGVVLCWFLIFSLAHEWMHRLHNRWFCLPIEKFVTVHYTAMAIYKIGILLFNLVPFIALLMI